MIKAVRIYVEGGGKKKDSRLLFRTALKAFFNKAISSDRNIQWDIRACGSRNAAYDDFRNDDSLDHPEAVVIPLVDSEGPVSDGHTAGQHLQITDKWLLKRQHGDRCHLMVQMMEAWFLADVEALVGYYGAGFNRNSIPVRRQRGGNLPRSRLDHPGAVTANFATNIPLVNSQRSQSALQSGADITATSILVRIWP
jgi:hypothetical protein